MTKGKDQHPSGPSGRGRDDDGKLWDFVIRTVAPLAGRRDRVAGPPAPPKPQARPAAAPVDLSPVGSEIGLKPAPPRGPVSAGLDRRTAERLRRGQMPIEAALDLHGLRQGEARDHLFRFLRDSSAAGRRCVLVITGKGRRDRGEDGILHRSLPVWLALPDIADLILSSSPARPKDGGDGAFYVLLRRNR